MRSFNCRVHLARRCRHFFDHKTVAISSAASSILSLNTIKNSSSLPNQMFTHSCTHSCAVGHLQLDVCPSNKPSSLAHGNCALRICLEKRCFAIPFLQTLCCSQTSHAQSIPLLGICATSSWAQERKTSILSLAGAHFSWRHH